MAQEKNTDSARVGRSIITANLPGLIIKLNQSLADEWLAYYQYYICAKLVTGPMRSEAIIELAEHAQEELDHANKLTDRIIQLGGTPLLTPDLWAQNAQCSYTAHKNLTIYSVLQENIKGEQCAITWYSKLAESLDGDRITQNLILDILADEIEHEDDLCKLVEDLDALKAL